MTFQRVVMAVLVIALMAGCASDPRPKYVAPATPKEENAVLKSGWGIYIQEVDGAPDGSAGFYVETWGGNSVQVTPGTHDLLLMQHHSSAGPVIWHSTYSTRFSFNCEKGHTYEFSPRNFVTSKMKVTDKTLGTSMDIDPGE